MSFLNGTRFTDRAAAAAKARKEMAEKFLANSKYDPADPAVVERETKRKAILEARKVRDVERAKRKAEQEAAEAARRVVGGCAWPSAQTENPNKRLPNPPAASSRRPPARSS